VLGNLIDNAAEAMCSGEEKHITVCLWEDARAFRFYVENTGAPIRPDVAENMFSQGFSTKGEGRGMGLHIVSDILGGYGGSIRLDESAPLTRFSGEVPRTLSLNT